jgi:hypothetical protein
MIYQIYDNDGSEMGLITSPLPQEIVQELFTEYHKEYWDRFCEGDVDDFSLDDFVDIYRHDKGYDVDVFFIDGHIHPETEI